MHDQLFYEELLDWREALPPFHAFEMQDISIGTYKWFLKWPRTNSGDDCDWPCTMVITRIRRNIINNIVSGQLGLFIGSLKRARDCVHTDKQTAGIDRCLQSDENSLSSASSAVSFATATAAAAGVGAGAVCGVGGGGKGYRKLDQMEPKEKNQFPQSALLAMPYENRTAIDTEKRGGGQLQQQRGQQQQQQQPVNCTKERIAGGEEVGEDSSDSECGKPSLNEVVFQICRTSRCACSHEWTMPTWHMSQCCMSHRNMFQCNLS